MALRLRRLLRPRTLGLVSLSVLAGLLVGELLIRFVGLDPPPRDGYLGAQVHRLATGAYADVLEIELAPSKRNTVRYPEDRGAPARDVTYRINSRGFREREFRLQEPSRKQRLLCLGDSFTFGTGVAVEDSWPRQFERLCEAEGLAVQALNLGVYRFNALQQEALLRRALEEGLEASGVLWCFYVNDASGHGFEEDTDGRACWETDLIGALGLTSGTWEQGTEANGRMAATMGLRRASALADYLCFSAHEALHCRVQRRNYLNDWRRGGPGLAAVAACLVRVRDLCDAHGLELDVCMYPALLGTFDNAHPYDEVHGALAAVAADAGVAFHDLRVPLEGRDPRELWAHAHDRHPNGECHRLVATYLRDRLPLGGAHVTLAHTGEPQVGTVAASAGLRIQPASSGNR